MSTLTLAALGIICPALFAAAFRFPKTYNRLQIAVGLVAGAVFAGMGGFRHGVRRALETRPDDGPGFDVIAGTATEVWIASGIVLAVSVVAPLVELILRSDDDQ